MENEAASEKEIQFIYCNGFKIDMGAGDCVVTLQVGREPTVALCLSHHVAKSLALKLNASLKIIEDATGQEILDLDAMNKLLLSHNEAKK